MTARRRLTLRLPAEVALIGVSVATLVGFHRLFTDWSFFPKAFLLTVTSHLVAIALRRRRMPLPLAALISALACVLIGTWLLYQGTTRYGLPTGTTLDLLTSDIREAITLFRDVEAPAEALPGFVAGTGLALWIVAFLADWSAFRLWAPFEATLPAAGLFVFASLFGADQFRASAALLFLLAVLAFLLLHRSSRLESSAAWIRGDAARGGRALVRAGAGLAALALGLAAVTGPLLPGARGKPVVDWKHFGGGNGTRVTLSPLVDIQSRLIQQKDVEVFNVRSDERSYWRLTALDAFDGRLWKSSRKFTKTNGELPSAGQPASNGDLVRQVFTIQKLAQIWLPAAFEPRSVNLTGLVTRWEQTTSTLIVDTVTSDGLVYDVTSAVPRFEAASLASVTAAPPADIAAQFLQLPTGFSSKVENEARRVTRDGRTPFEKALALERYFRDASNGFTYSLQVQKGHGGDRLEQFLFDDKVGYCEQYAGAYAAMARAVGLPARVAVGFTPGDADRSDPNLYHVKGKHAHAWPEVYLSGYGWVLFEPTPGRGAPGADYTGVAEQQDGTTFDTPQESASTTTPPTLPDPSTSVDNIDPGAVPGQGSAGSETPAEPGTPDQPAAPRTKLGFVALLAGLIGLYLAAVPGTKRLIRARRRARASTPSQQIDVAWQEAMESLGVLGLRAAEAETPLEFAQRAQRRARLDSDRLADLAALTTGARYSGEGASEQEASRARSGAVALAEHVREHTTVGQRLGYELSPRPLIRRPRRRGGRRGGRR